MSSMRATTGSSSHCRLQLRLAFDRLLQGDRVGRVLRHQLGELVDLAVRHFEHAADVAHHAARQQRAEGDDLRDLLLAIALLHVLDDALAPVDAEVDVEVGHRDAFGIEEALEQQAEPQRIEIRDGQRVGDERAGAGAAARADRNVVVLRPFDEVGDDQEVARKLHPLDDADLEGETVVDSPSRSEPGAGPCAAKRGWQAPPRPGGAVPRLRRAVASGPRPKLGRIGLRVATR